MALWIPSSIFAYFPAYENKLYSKKVTAATDGKDSWMSVRLQDNRKPRKGLSGQRGNRRRRPEVHSSEADERPDVERNVKKSYVSPEGLYSWITNIL
ncbi:MAG: hypothetical protein ACOYU7_07825 [Bacillota bacterium]